MESILLSIVSSYLKDYVKNFRKEQISVNFLRGQGVIKDLDINVDAINDTIFQSGAPGLRFTRIMINTLSIDAPFMSLKSKPIVVHIDEIFIEIGEVVDIQNKTKSPSPQTKQKSPKYGFTDRVFDSLSFEINRVFFALKTLGRLKTTEVGQWTPPVLLVEMTGNRYVSTNQSGVETELEECFRVRQTKRPMLFVYKKFVCKKVSAYLVNPEVWDAVCNELIHGKDHKNLFMRLNSNLSPGTRGYVTSNIVKNLSLGINLAMRKRLDNNRMLGFELAFIFDNVHVCLNQKAFSEFVHLAIGVLYALSRKDVIHEIYGPNPHDEHHLRVASATPPKAAASDKKAVSASGKRGSEKVDNEHLASLEKLDAEISSASTTLLTDDDWQRSSLSNDEDPPHLRLVLSWEVTDAIVTLSFDGFDSDDKHHDANNRAKKQYGSVFRGVNIHILGLVYSTIWPEHASGTEGVQQVTFKSLVLDEFVGVRKTCLFRTTLPLDDRGKPLCINILPRGVRELSQYDPESQPGISFAYRRESDFPPPPISKRIASRLEMMVGNIEIICNLDAWYWLLNFIVESWDERWINGEWNTKGRLEDMLGNGSAETVIIFNAIQILVYPDFIRHDTTTVPFSSDSTSTAISHHNHISNSNTILPSQIIIDVGLLSLIWRHNLNLKSLSELRAMDLDSLSNRFPTSASDVSAIMDDLKPVKGIDLLSDRFEASISQISVKVITDTTHDAALHDIANAPTRTIVHPFGFVFSTSVDPHPNKLPLSPSKESFLSPYTRIYYWALNSSTISSSALKFDDIRIECSAIDITRLTHIIQLVNNWVTSISAASLHHAAADNNHDATEDYYASAGYPTVIKVLRFSKINIQLLKDDDTVRKVHDGQGLSEADVILGVEINALDIVAEWTDSQVSWSSDSMLIKGQVKGIAILAGNRPVFIVVNDEMNNVIQLAGSAGQWQIKSTTTTPVLSMRYQANVSDLQAILSSLADEMDTPTNELMIHQASERLGEGLVTISDANFCISPMTKIIISLQNIDEALQSFLSELLSGAGVIFSNSEDWLDSSILGYIMRIYREIASESVNANSIAINKKRTTEEEKAAASSRPMALTINLDNSDLILLDIHPFTQGDYVGFGSHFDTASVQAMLRLPSEPLGLILDWISTQQLYLFSGYIEKSIERQYFTNIFPIICHAHKFEADPLMMKSSLIMKDVLSSVNQESSDIANRLVRENLQALGKGMALLSSDKKGIVHYVQNSWTEISRGVSAATQSLGLNRIKEDAKGQMESLLGLTMHLLENSKTLRRRELEHSSSDIDNLQHDIISSENQLVQNLRAEIQVNYRRLQTFTEKYNRFPEDLLSSVEDIDRAIKALDTCVDKLEHFAVLSSNLTPSYCGWLRRSHGFSRSDRSTHGSRYWCLLVRETLYFMNQPYAKKIEHEVYLDKAFILVDPDDIDTTSGSTTTGKTSLSSMVWISNPERNAHDEGVLVIDCLTLDEKCMWKEALKAWVPIDPNASKHLPKAKSILSFHFGSPSTTNHPPVHVISSLTDDCSSVASASAISSPVNTASLNSYSGSKSINRFRAVSKGMLRAISMSRGGGNHASITATSTSVSVPILSTSVTPPASRQSSKQPMDGAIAMRGDGERESLSSVGSNPVSDHQSPALAVLTSNASYHPDRGASTSTTISDLLNELDDLRPPLYQHTLLMDTLRTTYQKKFQETKQLVEAMRDSFLAMFLGLSILHTIEDENDRAVKDEIKECKVRINQLLKELHEEKAKNHVLLENWAKAKQQQRESESVLQAITMQHISTVLNMSKQYDDLMDQYQMIRMGAQEAAYYALGSTKKEADPVTPQDLIRQLAKALQESETQFKQSSEREAMMAQEVNSIVIETDSTRQENAELLDTIAGLRAEAEKHKKQYEQDLEDERKKSKEFEREKDMYQKRYESMVEVLQRLGLPPDSSP